MGEARRRKLDGMYPKRAGGEWSAEDRASVIALLHEGLALEPEDSTISGITVFPAGGGEPVYIDAATAKRQRTQQAERVLLDGLRSAAASASERSIAFLRSRPRMVVQELAAPSCRCRTFCLWRPSQNHRWQCFACDPPRDRDAVEVVRAEIPGRPVWDAATRRWV